MDQVSSLLYRFISLESLALTWLVCCVCVCAGLFPAVHCRPSVRGLVLVRTKLVRRGRARRCDPEERLPATAKEGCPVSDRDESSSGRSGRQAGTKLARAHLVLPSSSGRVLCGSAGRRLASLLRRRCSRARSRSISKRSTLTELPNGVRGSRTSTRRSSRSRRSSRGQHKHAYNPSHSTPNTRQIRNDMS